MMHRGVFVCSSHTIKVSNTLKYLFRPLVRFLKAEDGPTAVEYAVMLALIIIVCIVAVISIGTSSSATFSKVGSVIKPASS